MQEDIIYKLKTLQSIEPEEAWKAEKKRKLIEKVSVFGVKNDIFLSSSDIYATKQKFNLGALIPNRLAVSFTSIVIVLTSGIFTVGASQSSVPGETLYSVKKASEQVALAVASQEEKPKIEIEQAGKRLEELAQISQKTSDANQHQKIEQLVADFQDKVDSANTHLSQLNEKGKSDTSVKVASTAKVVNEQSEKYTEVLQKTTDSLPETVKEKVAEKVADATKTTEKTNIASLLVMVESKEQQDTEDIAAKVQKTVEKAEAKVNELSVQTTTAVATQVVCSEADIKNNTAATDSVCSSKDKNAENVVIAEEAVKKLEEAKENLKNSNLTDTLRSVSEVTEITAQVSPAVIVATPVKTSVSTEVVQPATEATETAPKS